jgi:HK97 family phage major capsid protein
VTTRELETISKEIAEVSAFVKEHVAPLAEERVRLHDAVSGLVRTAKDSQRRSLLGIEGRSVVDSGPYAGCDALDLAIVRSLHRAAQAHGGGAPVEDWGVRLRAAMDSVTSGSGDELVPTAEANELWRDVNLDTVVGSLFSRIDMPTSPFDIPLQLGDVNWYPGTENTATTATALATAKQTLTAHELVAEVPWSLTLEEDAVIAMLPEVRRSLVRNSAEVIDDVLLVG